MKWPERHHTGVVDQHVDRAKLLFDSIEKALERIAVGDVKSKRGVPTRQVCQRALLIGQIDVARADGSARAEQLAHDREADAAATAGNRDDVAFDGARHTCLGLSLAAAGEKEVDELSERGDEASNVGQRGGVEHRPRAVDLAGRQQALALKGFERPA